MFEGMINLKRTFIVATTAALAIGAGGIQASAHSEAAFKPLSNSPQIVKPHKANAKAKPAPMKPKTVKKQKPKPTAGYGSMQMRNACLIVAEGQARRIPHKGLVIAIATAMQESTLYNRASVVYPVTYHVEHQGDGSDHDSVGLFQQRPASGWGTPRELMKPRVAAGKFFRELVKVYGWVSLPVTVAAQTVQGSAFPDAYADDEDAARLVVAECLRVR